MPGAYTILFKSIHEEKPMDIDTHNELETKACIPADAVVTHAEMMRAFETFKQARPASSGEIYRCHHCGWVKSTK